nr:MAG: NACHT domain-containing protein [Leptolyngbya sp. IPPAS B-1204]
MNTLTLKLFGSPQISLDGHSITHLISRKAQALLIYVAVTGKLHSREMLADLFWQNMPSNQAMKNLRTVLPALRQLVGSHLIITRQTILFNRECSYYLDVEAVAAIEDCSKTNIDMQFLTEAVSHYQGDFLEGFYVPDAPEFENWVLMERERLREVVIEGLHHLAEHYLKHQNYTEGLATTRKLLMLDPSRETAHQQQMLFLARSGQRRAALAQYNTCRQILAVEFNVEPMAETTALCERIRAGDLDGSDLSEVESCSNNNENLSPNLLEASQDPLFEKPSKLESRHRHGSNKSGSTDSNSLLLTSRSPFSYSELPYLPMCYCDWGEAIDVSIFYGRETELSLLQKWVIQDHNRLVLLLGMGGIGKTALAVKLAQTIQTEFEYVIWRSLRNAPPLESLLADLVPFLSNQQDSRAEIGRLVHWLRTHRCLVILDNAETLFQEGSYAGQYRSGLEVYGELFRVVGEVQHQSCVLLTSREKLAEVAALEGDPAAQTLVVTGSPTMAQALLETRGLLGSPIQKQQLAQQYGYNPLALKIVTSSIHDMFEGDIEKFLKQDVILFNGIRRLLEHQFKRLSPLEQSIMYWLAINREWTTIAELAEDIVASVPRVKLLEALESLSWRNLIERRQGYYTQQPIVMEYITSTLVETVGNEIVGQNINLFDSYGLIKANVKEYIRETQKRLILSGVATQLQSQLATSEQIEVRLQKILRLLQSRSVSPVYAAGNLINLCCYLQIDLTGYDFSQLSLRHAQLQGQWLQFVNFQDSQFETSSFTQVVKASFALAFSPDGTLLGSGNNSGDIFVRRVVDNHLLLSWQGHSNTIWTLVWSPDGETFATAGNDGMIRIWDAYTGECLQAIQGPSVVWSVAWSPDGQMLASVGAEAALRLWDVDTGECIQIFSTQDHGNKAVVWSPDGQWVVTGGDDGAIKFWHFQTGTCGQTLSGHGHGIWDLAWNDRGDYPQSTHPLRLASASADHTIRIWEPHTGQCLQTLQGHINAVLRVAWSPDGCTLASSSDDSTVRLWGGQTGRCLRILQGHQNTVWSLAWSPVEPLIASGSFDHTTRLWDAQTGDCLSILQGYSACIRALAWHADNQTLVTGSDDRIIRLWNTSTGECLKKLRGSGNCIWSIAWSPDGERIVSSGDDQTIQLWHPHTGQYLKTLVGHTNWVWSVAWSPDGQTIISGSNDQSIRVWDSNTGQCLQCFQSDAWVTAIAPSPDGKLVASGGMDCTVWLYNLKTGERLISLQGHHGWIWSVAWSPDGKMLATGSEDGTTRLWDAQTGDCLRVLHTSSMRIFSVAWSPDGQQLACGGGDPAVQIWDVYTGQCVQRLEGHTHSLWTVAWQPAGHLLASAGDDDTIRIWQVSTGQCLNILRADRPYEGMNITGTTGLTKAQKTSLKALGAVEQIKQTNDTVTLARGA